MCHFWPSRCGLNKIFSTLSQPWLGCNAVYTVSWKFSPIFGNAMVAKRVALDLTLQCRKDSKTEEGIDKDIFSNYYLYWHNLMAL